MVEVRLFPRLRVRFSPARISSVQEHEMQIRHVQFRISANLYFKLRTYMIFIPRLQSWGACVEGAGGGATLLVPYFVFLSYDPLQILVYIPLFDIEACESVNCSVY